jgi:hemolysin III
VNKTLEQVDHAMIYFLIAGTYTPICLVVLRGGWGWSLFGVNWALAITGMVLKLVFRRPSRGIIALLFVFYIIMGWLVVIAWGPLVRALPQAGLCWLILGGVFYTVGAVVFNLKRLNFAPHFGAHEIWHLFVLAGSCCHFWFMLKYVLYLK